MKPSDLTDEMIRAYFEQHCECRPTDIERTSHSNDCDEDACEDVRVAMGGKPVGQFAPRSTSTALIQRNAARARICDAINARASKEDDRG